MSFDTEALRRALQEACADLAAIARTAEENGHPLCICAHYLGAPTADGYFAYYSQKAEDQAAMRFRPMSDWSPLRREEGGSQC